MLLGNWDLLNRNIRNRWIHQMKMEKWQMNNRRTTNQSQFRHHQLYRILLNQYHLALLQSQTLRCIDRTPGELNL